MKVVGTIRHHTARSLMASDGAGTAQMEDTKVDLKRTFLKPNGQYLVFKGELKGRLIRPRGGFNNNVDLGILKESRFRRMIQAMKKGIPFVPGVMLVTDSGVAFLVDDWDADTLNISDMNFHDSGTGVAAAAVGDTTLGTPAGPTTRATGTKSQPTANQIRSVGTIAYTGTLAITEWGLFSTANRATLNLWDRRVFTAINVVNGDSIQFTYTLTINSGG